MPLLGFYTVRYSERTHFGKYLLVAFVIALVVIGETLINLMNKQAETIRNL
jgi:hypothetical protein